MRRRVKSSTSARALFFILGAVAFVARAFCQIPPSSHVFLVVLENHSYSTVTNSSDPTNYMPWLISQGNAYGYAANYITDNAGSLLDYIWLSSGCCESSARCTLPSGYNDFGCSGGTCNSVITDNNIYREMINSGISWRLYAESLPYVGYVGIFNDPYNEYYPYDLHHNAPQWYSDVYNSTTQRDNMVPFTQFATDLAANQRPRYSLIIPNDLDDAHDGTAAQADAWLNTNLTPLLNSPFFQPCGDGLLIITWDEGDSSSNPQVYTAVIGPRVIPHTVSTTLYYHENTLRTIVDALGITPPPGWAAYVSGMTDFFGAPSGCTTQRRGQVVSE
jgi:hypothetical protein